MDDFNTNSMLQTLQQRRQNNLQPQAPTPGYDMSGILGPIQQEITTSQGQLPQYIQNYMNTRQQQQGQLQQSLGDTINAQMTTQQPLIEDRLQNLGILQSGAYPAQLAKERANLIGSEVLPMMAQFQNQTFNTASQLPLTQMTYEQQLRNASNQRQFGLQDISNQQQFQTGLADKTAQQQQLASLLGLVPSLIGSGGIGGLMGGGGGIGGGSGGATGGLGGIGGASGSGMGGLAGLLPYLMSGQGGGLAGVLGGGAGGALGSALAGQLGIGSGWGGALGGIAGGGGLGGALGGGVGGALGGTMGAGLGGAIGAFGQPYAQDWFSSLFSPGPSDMGGFGVLQQPQTDYLSSLFGGGSGLPDMSLWGDMGGQGVLSDLGGSGVLSNTDWYFGG